MDGLCVYLLPFFVKKNNVLKNELVLYFSTGFILEVSDPFFSKSEFHYPPTYRAFFFNFFLFFGGKVVNGLRVNLLPFFVLKKNVLKNNWFCIWGIGSIH